MRKLLFGALLLAGLAAVGCGGPDVTGSTEPLTEEQKRQIAADDQRTNEEESPGNKTNKPKPGKK
jgi:hypothetical protein